MNMNKDELRKYIRGKKRQFTDKELEELSLPVITRLLSHPAVMSAKTLLMYYSLPDEVNTHDIIMQLAESGKNVLLPCVTDGENMEIREYNNPEDMQEGGFGIMEPTGKPFTSYDEIDVAVIPGMGFDNSNNRLGRGKGYYDRFLSKVSNVYKIGICFDFQKLPKIPVSIHDIRMDTVI